MKKILFVFALLLQSLIIIVISGQHKWMNDYGQEITLLIHPQEIAEEYGYDQDVLYLDYEIQTVPIEKWYGLEDTHYNEKVYVRLVQGEDGIYDVKEASTNKLQAIDKEIIVLAKYLYQDEINQVIHLSYGLEVIDDDQFINKLNVKKPMMAKWIVSPWGQKKLIDIENIDL